MSEHRVVAKAGWNLEHSYTRLPETFYSRLHPVAVPAPKLVQFNTALATKLGLDVVKLRGEEGVAIFSGNRVPEGARPLAQAYAGHQFGHFTMLGDGRALLLGEQRTPAGERLDVQLKGSGRTPYSRNGDGRATLGPMLREYIISEAMHALGVPTTRSLAVVTTGQWVLRETELPGAVLTRTATSHLRVGTFEYAARWGTAEDLRSLADYAIQRHYPNAHSADNPYLGLLHEVVKRQAALIAQWQLVGFVHGVMNTDNMTISGETIDYGPCAFMDTYDPATVFSSIDSHGRYAYSHQPRIAVWNLARYAETLLPLFHDKPEEAVAMAEEIISAFSKLYHDHWIGGMRSKLGIVNQEHEDEQLIHELLGIQQKHGADYTNTFRALAREHPEETGLMAIPEFTQWYERWQARLARQEAETSSINQLMRRSNPAVIPRNHRVEEALEAAVNDGNYDVMERLLGVLAKPYAYSSEQDSYAIPPAPSNAPYRTYCGT